MTLIVESGAGLPDAESFASVAFATAHHERRAQAGWALLALAAKEAALVKATDYLQATYGQRWAGRRVNAVQALDWPRYEVPHAGLDGDYPSNSLPVELQRACAELALRASAADLAPDLEAQVKSEEVGPIRMVYADGARQSAKYQAIDRLLAPLLAGAGTVKMIRA